MHSVQRGVDRGVGRGGSLLAAGLKRFLAASVFSLILARLESLFARELALAVLQRPRMLVRGHLLPASGAGVFSSECLANGLTEWWLLGTTATARVSAVQVVVAGRFTGMFAHWLPVRLPAGRLVVPAADAGARAVEVVLPRLLSGGTSASVGCKRDLAGTEVRPVSLLLGGVLQSHRHQNTTGPSRHLLRQVVVGTQCRV